MFYSIYYCIIVILQFRCHIYRHAWQLSSAFRVARPVLCVAESSTRRASFTRDPSNGDTSVLQGELAYENQSIKTNIFHPLIILVWSNRLENIYTWMDSHLRKFPVLWWVSCRGEMDVVSLYALYKGLLATICFSTEK